MTSPNRLGWPERAVLLLAFISTLAPLPAGAEEVSTPLRAHRSQTSPASPRLTGRVVALTADAITTSVGRDQLLDAGVGDEDVVTVRVAGRAIPTRFLEPATVAAVLGSRAALDTFDVDVVCTTDARNAVVIVGRGGGLPAWLQLQPGMPVILEKP